MNREDLKAEFSAVLDWKASVGTIDKLLQLVDDYCISQNSGNVIVSGSLPHYRYVVYSGSEKLDLGDKSPIAMCRYKADAELLLTKFYPYGYIEEIGGNDH